jgi:hypothetical protein
MNKHTLVCTITTMMISACVCKREEEEEEERREMMEKKKASLTVSGHGMETTHTTRTRRKK